ncbi:MAG: hypothetical protein OEZ55_07875, partial [Nitrospinota bacterium]|nr:hypothetical protein [Nitrospinota bacterium]
MIYASPRQPHLGQIVGPEFSINSRSWQDGQSKPATLTVCKSVNIPYPFTMTLVAASLSCKDFCSALSARAIT